MDKIVAILIAIGVFIAGYFIGHFSTLYGNYVGEMHVSESEDGQKLEYKLQLSDDIQSLKDHRYIMFAVRSARNPRT